MENELEHFGTPCSEPEIKLEVCMCGAEVSEVYQCFCTDEVCEECGDRCVECGKLFHAECLVKDLEGYELCQPCFDMVLFKSSRYDDMCKRLRVVQNDIDCMISEGE